MAATLNSAPTSPAYNGNDIWIEVASDLVNTASAATFSILFSSSGPSVGQVLTLTWGGTELALTVAASTNSTATAIPTKGGGESIADYALRVAGALRENGTLSADFRITNPSSGTVLLTSRTNGALDLTAVENLDGTAVTVTDGTDPNTETNLAAQVEVWKAGADFSSDERITTLHATYDAATGTTALNLSELFPVKPHLPNAAHIDPGIFSTWLKGTATDAWAEYYLRIADKYGSPAVPEALLKSDDNYFVIHGARSADRDGGTSFGVYVDKLHNYRTLDGSTFWKPIGDEQPDWLYIWTKSALTGCNVEWDIEWDDGSTNTETYSGTAFSLDIHKVYYIRTTPLNFNFTPPSAGALPWHITFRLKGDGGSGEATIAEVKYKAVIGTSWERWLLFDNGLGGCESALFNGKAKEGFSVKRETARMTRTADFSIAEGELLAFNAEGQKEYELNTGWIPKWYAEHLRQLLMGDVWMVDFDNERFIKLICETDSVTTSETDQQLFSISAKFRTAWSEKATNI